MINVSIENKGGFAREWDESKFNMFKTNVLDEVVGTIFDTNYCYVHFLGDTLTELAVTPNASQFTLIFSDELLDIKDSEHIYSVKYHESGKVINATTITDALKAIKLINERNKNKTSLKYNPEVMKKIVEKDFIQNKEFEVNKTKLEIREKEERIVDMRKRLSEQIKRLEQLNLQYKIMLNTGTDLTILKEIDTTLNTHKVLNIEYKDEKFLVYTDDLFIENYDEFYYVGKTIIEIGFMNNTIKVHRGEGNKCAYKSIWSSNNNAFHPHVNPESGTPCFGNIENILPDLLAGQELSSLVTLLITYLESVDERDAAGEYIRYWDTVTFNDDGTFDVIKCTYSGGYCDDCEEHFDEDDLRTVYDMDGERTVCEYCREQNYYYVEDQSAYYSESLLDYEGYAWCEYHDAYESDVKEVRHDGYSDWYCIDHIEDDDDIVEVNGIYYDKDYAEEEGLLDNECDEDDEEEVTLHCPVCGEKAEHEHNGLALCYTHYLESIRCNSDEDTPF